MELFREFREFLKEYKVIALAIAFIIGLAATALIQSLVINIIMPIITFFIPNGGWQTSTLKLGSVVLGWGAFLAALVNFLIIAYVVFVISRLVLKEENLTKK